MHRPTMRAKRAIQERLDHGPSPRQEAIRWLAAELAAGRAGLDVYDRTILIIEPQDHEHVWTRAVILMCGLEMNEHAGSYRCVLDTDVRGLLDLDGEGAPLMDAPLASRGADVAEAAGNVFMPSVVTAPGVLVDANARPNLILLTDREVH